MLIARGLKDRTRFYSLIVGVISLLLLVCSCNKPSNEELLVGKRWILTKVYLGKYKKHKWAKLNTCNRFILHFYKDSTYHLEDKCPQLISSDLIKSEDSYTWRLNGNRLYLNGLFHCTLVKLNSDQLVLQSMEPKRKFVYYFTCKEVRENQAVWEQLERLSFKGRSKYRDSNCYFTLNFDSFNYYKEGKLVYRDRIKKEKSSSIGFTFDSREGDRLTINGDTAKLLRYNGDGDTEIFIKKWRTVKL